MSRPITKFKEVKDVKGRYTEEFKSALAELIKQGKTTSEAGKELGVDAFGSGFRQLYYKMQREITYGKELPTLKAKGVKSDKEDTSESKIKTEGFVEETKPIVKESKIKVKKDITNEVQQPKLGSMNAKTLQGLTIYFDSIEENIKSDITAKESEIASYENLIKFRKAEIEECNKRLKNLENVRNEYLKEV
jgi:transposase-like protein